MGNVAEFPTGEGTLPTFITTLAGPAYREDHSSGSDHRVPVPGEFGIAGIAASGRDDRLWFTENDSGMVGGITTSGEVGQRFGTGSYPFAITSGPDGNMWFCVGYGNAIGRVNVS